MEKYNVIIIGAGIAGAGLVYNLKKIGYKGSVLIIDKKSPGGNADYGYRNTFKDIIEEYKLPYSHKFDGLKVGTYDKILLTIKENFYFFNYQDACKKLIKDSYSEFKQEEALDVQQKILITNRGKYYFDFLIDCSGHNFFLNKKFKKSLPKRYWIGETRVIEKEHDLENYFYHQFSEEEYLEDLYPLKNKILHGHWQYAKKIDFNSIKPHNKTLYKTLLNSPKEKEKFHSVIPCSPVSPLIGKYYVCLGDSFGNSYTSSACGIRPILDTSLIMAHAIKRNNLSFFKKVWEKKYLNYYLKFLVSKFDTYNNPKFIQKIKNYPGRTECFCLMNKNPKDFLRIFDGDDTFKLPKNIQKKFPRYQKIFQLAYWIYLNANYKMGEISRI